MHFRVNNPQITSINYTKDTKILLEELATQYNAELFVSISEIYIILVIEEKARRSGYWDELTKTEEFAKENYDRKCGRVDAFIELPADERRKLVLEALEGISQVEKDMLKSIRVEDSRKIAKKTVNKIMQLDIDGKFINGYNASKVLLNITKNIPQEEYLSQELYAAWREEFDVVGKSPEDTIDVYVFQNGGVVANNFMKFGDIGARDGMFCIFAKRYEALLKDTTLFYGDGICKDENKLSQVLGNVPIGIHPVAIKITVKVKDLKYSRGGLSTSYFGEFCPGFKTQGDTYEAVIPSRHFLEKGYINPHIKLISHSKYINPEEFEKIAIYFYKVYRKYFKSLNELEKERFAIYSYYDFINKITHDKKLLEDFRKQLSKEEFAIIKILTSTIKENAMQERFSNLKDASAVLSETSIVVRIK